MAVVNTKSAQITNADAVPAVISSAQSADAQLREKAAFAAAANGDSIGSTFRMFRVRSNDRVSQLLLSSDAIVTCAADIGLYRTAKDGGAAVSAALFGSAVSLATAQSNVDVTRESGTIAVADINKRVWELLGLSADPMTEYDVTLTLTAAAGSAGNMGLLGRIAGNY